MTKFHVVSTGRTVQTALLTWIIASADPDNTVVFKSIHDYHSILRSDKMSVQDVHLILAHSHPSRLLPGRIEQFKNVTQFTLFTAERMAERIEGGAEQSELRSNPYCRIFGPYHNQINEAWNLYRRGESMPDFVALAATSPDHASIEDRARYINVAMVFTHLIRKDLKFNDGQLAGRDFVDALSSLFMATDDELDSYSFAGNFAREKITERNEEIAKNADFKIMNGLSIPTVNRKPVPSLASELVKAYGIGCAFYITNGNVIGYIYMRPAAYEMLKPEMLKQQLPNCDLPLPWKDDDEYVYIMFEFPYEGNEHRFPLK